MSVPLRKNKRRGLAGMQREAKARTRRRDRCLDDFFGNRRQTDKVKERRAPSNMRGRGPCAWHFALPGKVTSGERKV